MPELPPGTTVTVNGVTAKVLIDGIKKGIRYGEGPWRDILYLVPNYDASDAFIDGLLGLIKYSAVGNKILSWPSPHPYPGNTNIYCTDAWGEPIGPIKPDPTKLVSAENGCRVTAHYEPLKLDVLGNQAHMAFGGEPVPWARDDFRGYMQAYPVEQGGLAFQSTVSGGDKTPPPNKYHLRVPHEEYRRTLTNVPYLFVETIRGLAGTLNAVPIWGCDRGTLLLEPWDSSIDNLTDGSRAQQVVITAVWRPIDWNKELMPNGLAWDYVVAVDANNAIITDDEGPVMPYKYRDHSILWQF